MCLPGTIETVRDTQTQVTRRAVLAGGGAAALAALAPGEAFAHKPKRRRRSGKVVDLTHTFTAGFPVYSGNPPSRRTLVTVQQDGFYAQEWTFGEHSGTHMDAPGHFVVGGRFVPQLSARELVLPIVVIDIAARAARDPDTAVTPAARSGSCTGRSYCRTRRSTRRRDAHPIGRRSRNSAHSSAARTSSRSSTAVSTPPSRDTDGSSCSPAIPESARAASPRS